MDDKKKPPNPPKSTKESESPKLKKKQLTQPPKNPPPQNASQTPEPPKPKPQPTPQPMFKVEEKRLPSFKGPRDLTLSGIVAAPARPRKNFVPNIPLKRDRDKAAAAAGTGAGAGESGPSSRGGPSGRGQPSTRGNVPGPSGSGGSGRGNSRPPRGGKKKVDFVQSTSIFQEGIGAQTLVSKNQSPVASGSGSRGGRGGYSSAVSKMREAAAREKPKTPIGSPAKKDDVGIGDEDCFIVDFDDDDVSAVLQPVSLPLLDHIRPMMLEFEREDEIDYPRVIVKKQLPSAMEVDGLDLPIKMEDVKPKVGRDPSPDSDIEILPTTGTMSMSMVPTPRQMTEIKPMTLSMSRKKLKPRGRGAFARVLREGKLGSMVFIQIPSHLPFVNKGQLPPSVARALVPPPPLALKEKEVEKKVEKEKEQEKEKEKEKDKDKDKEKEKDSSENANDKVAEMPDIEEIFPTPTPEIEKVALNLSGDFNDLPEGLIGKIEVMASGRARLVIGENTFYLKSGKQVGFMEQVVSYDKDVGIVNELGDITYKFSCIPEFMSFNNT